MTEDAKSHPWADSMTELLYQRNKELAATVKRLSEELIELKAVPPEPEGGWVQVCQSTNGTKTYVEDRHWESHTFQSAYVTAMNALIFANPTATAEQIACMAQEHANAAMEILIEHHLAKV